MAHQPPTFSGFIGQESIITFHRDFALYAAARTLTPAQQAVLYKACFRGPARTTLLWTITATAGGGGIADITDALTLTAGQTWMENHYHTPEIQQQLQDLLLSMAQESTESPLAFYTKINDVVDNAGYVDAVKAQVMKTTFMNGLQPEIALQI